VNRENGRIYVMLTGQLENVPQMRVGPDGRPFAVGTFALRNRLNQTPERWFRLLFFAGQAERIALSGKRGMWLEVHGWLVNRQGKEITVERFRELSVSPMER